MTRDADISKNLLAIYDAGVQAAHWQSDDAQRAAVAELQRLRAELEAAPQSLIGRVLKRFKKPTLIRGIYLHGGVGRGKTFLMDLFFKHLQIEQKQRLHFHHFMQQVHQELGRRQGESDPLEGIAELWASRARVLCFDEFFVTDIGDAMLLSGLLSGLFERGVALVATSNVIPDGLYADGLQRQRFLPAIQLLNTHCVVHELKAKQDFRLRALTKARVYLQASDSDTPERLSQLFKTLATAPVQENHQLDINQRQLECKATAGTVAWFSFAQICQTARSAEDYIELAREFQTVIVEDIPVLTDNDGDAARRFIFLIDEFYDRRVNLVVSAANAPTRIYQGKRLAFEFQRAASRLIEMQTEEYLAAGHKG